MKIAVTSDLHGQLVDPPSDADLVVLGGDICPDYTLNKTLSVAGQADWLNESFRPWLEMTAANGGEVVAVWGNHDYIGEAGEWKSLIESLPWTVLKDDVYVHESGYKIWGTPWVPRLQRWAFYGTPETLKRRADLIPEGLDMLVSHGPPHRVGDLVPAPKSQARIDKYHQYSDEFVGDPTLNDAIKRARPEITVCGHIHEARGVYAYDGSIVANVAAVDEFYVMREQPWLILNAERGDDASFQTSIVSPNW